MESTLLAGRMRGTVWRPVDGSGSVSVFADFTLDQFTPILIKQWWEARRRGRHRRGGSCPSSGSDAMAQDGADAE